MIRLSLIIQAGLPLTHKLGGNCLPSSFACPPVAVKSSILHPQYLISVFLHLLAAFMFASSERKTKSQMQHVYYNLLLKPKAFAKYKDSNKCCLSDWPSFNSFEKRVPYAGKGGLSMNQN